MAHAIGRLSQNFLFHRLKSPSWRHAEQVAPERGGIMAVPDPEFGSKFLPVLTAIVPDKAGERQGTVKRRSRNYVKQTDWRSRRRASRSIALLGRPCNTASRFFCVDAFARAPNTFVRRGQAALCRYKILRNGPKLAALPRRRISAKISSRSGPSRSAKIRSISPNA